MVITMKITELNEYCSIIDNKSDTDIIILHGFSSNKKHQYIFANNIAKDTNFNVIQCDARGHGVRKNREDILDWKGTIEDIKDIINKRNNKTILIGHSMGGTEAITIGLTQPNIKKVFAVSSIHGDEKAISQKKQEIIDIFELPKDFVERNIINVRDALPINYEKCNEENKNKFYLIHGKKDELVSFSEFEKNKQDLCIPDQNTLVLDDIPKFQLKKICLSHIIPFYDKRTYRFILTNIKEKN